VSTLAYRPPGYTFKEKLSNTKIITPKAISEITTKLTLKGYQESLEDLEEEKVSISRINKTWSINSVVKTGGECLLLVGGFIFLQICLFWQKKILRKIGKAGHNDNNNPC
jgi:hypothetical protein